MEISDRTYERAAFSDAIEERLEPAIVWAAFNAAKTGRQFNANITAAIHALDAMHDIWERART